MGTYKVLVIDDEDVIRKAIRLALEDAGHDVIEAANGRDGLEQIQAATTSLVVIVDLMMPRLTGVGLLHAVGHDKGLASHHAFIVSTAARAFPVEDLAGYLPGGHLYVVHKPFAVDELIAVVENAGARFDH